MKWAMLANTAAWIATGAAIAVACLVTKSGWWLWFMLVPLLGSVGNKETKTPKQGDQ